MKVSVDLPDIGEGVAEGQVIDWLKNVGDEVRKDEPIVTVMTDKATVELPSPYAGILTHMFYKQGDIAKVHA
ncbi:MAG: biotin/lipoyl-containing protein, partial [Waddliaceae bacterium]